MFYDNSIDLLTNWGFLKSILYQPLFRLSSKNVCAQVNVLLGSSKMRRNLEFYQGSQNQTCLQIYCLDENLFGKDWCLSGTSEIAIANYLRNRKFHSSELPINFAAVSRCYRAEISQLAEERGLYR